MNFILFIVINTITKNSFLLNFFIFNLFLYTSFFISLNMQCKMAIV
jgi:hypothetical protein